MLHRLVASVAVAALLLLPLAFTAPAAQGPDLKVMSLTIQPVAHHVLLTTTYCNVGDTPVTGATVAWYLTATPGPLNQGAGTTYHVNTLPVSPAVPPGKCASQSTFFWITRFPILGEYEFATAIGGDADASNNELKVPYAYPSVLAGSGLGGFDF